MATPIIAAPTSVTFIIGQPFSTEDSLSTQIRVMGATSINVEGEWHDNFHREINGEVVEIKGTSSAARNGKIWTITATNSDGTSTHIINYDVVHTPIVIPDITQFQISRYIEADMFLPITGIPVYGSIEGELLGLRTELVVSDTGAGIRIIGHAVDAAEVADDTYNFKIIAGNTAGQREKSGQFELVSIRLPDAPTNVTVTPDNGQITISWSASANNGGSPILRYEVRLNEEDWIDKGTTAGFHVFSGLANGISYKVGVRAITAWGESETVSFNSTPMITSTVPGPPRNVIHLIGYGSFTVRWETPDSDGGSAITGYEIRLGTGNWIEKSAIEVSHTFTDLTQGADYTFSVRTKNAVGVSTTVSQDLSLIAVPLSPTNVEVVRGDGQLTLTWEPPTLDGGSAITGYEVRVGNNAWISKDANAREHTFTGLNNGTYYTLYVRAQNSVGNSNARETQNTQPNNVPDRPTNLRATAGDGQITYTWDAPTFTGGSELVGYVLGVLGGGTYQTFSVRPNLETYTVMNLTNGTEYSAIIWAYNINGAGQSASFNSATPSS